mgnify:CR=1 FL=1
MASFLCGGLNRQIEHRQSEAAKRLAEADALKRELADVVDRWANLIAEEQKILRPESNEESTA